MRHGQWYSCGNHVHLCNGLSAAQPCCNDWGMSSDRSRDDHHLIEMQEKEHLQQCQMLYVNLLSVCE